jgi:hypothetical protein
MTSSAELAARQAFPVWPASQSDRDIFAKARNQTLNLAQWLARIANSYVAGDRPEDRVLLGFSRGIFVTKPFDREFALELRLPTLEMQFQERGKPAPHILNPEEHSPAEAEAWILIELLHRGIERDKFSKSLPYAIDNLMSGDAEDYTPEACADGLELLNAWLCAAASILSPDGRVACQPESITLIAATGGQGDMAGFSPGDPQHNEPYFFTGTGSSRRRLTASQLAKEKNPVAVAAEFIGRGAAVRRA